MIEAPHSLEEAGNLASKLMLETAADERAKSRDARLGLTSLLTFASRVHLSSLARGKNDMHRGWNCLQV